MSKRESKKHVTLSDIAASAGVAAMTVSRVMNQTGYVHEETREKVLLVARQMNYRRNELARGLKRRRTDTVGMVIGDIANPFTAELIRGAREVLTAQGYTLFICVSEQSAKDDAVAFDALTDHRVDGIIVARRESKLGNDRLAEVIEAGTPVSLIGREFAHPQADFVTANHLKGGYEATKHLIALGHRRIGFIGVSLTTGLGLHRFHGYLDALREHDLPVEESLVVGGRSGSDLLHGYSTEEMGYDGMNQLLSLAAPPTAVFARNDFTAFGAIGAIRDAGLRIPEDVAIVGHDDLPLAAHISPPLTTVRQPAKQQGRLAAECLLRRIASNEHLPREEHRLDCELVIRGSTGTAPASRNTSAVSRRGTSSRK